MLREVVYNLMFSLISFLSVNCSQSFPLKLNIGKLLTFFIVAFQNQLVKFVMGTQFTEYVIFLFFVYQAATT